MKKVFCIIERYDNCDYCDDSQYGSSRPIMVTISKEDADNFIKQRRENYKAKASKYSDIIIKEDDALGGLRLSGCDYVAEDIEKAFDVSYVFSSVYFTWDIIPVEFMES